MNEKKLVTELTEEELLNLISEDSTPLEQVEDDKIQVFCSAFDIKPGNYAVHFKFVRSLYKKWTKNSKEIVKTEFEKYFQFDKDAIYINKTVIELQSLEKIKFKRRIQDKLKNSKYQKHFTKFLKEYDIEKGTLWVPSYLLFHIYDKWIYQTKPKQSLVLSYFIKFFKFHFSYKFDDVYYFRIDEKFLKHLTQESIENIKAAHEKSKKNRRSKVKYPALKPEYNLKSRTDLIDYDYINKLSAEEKEWLNSFTEEYVNANFDHDGPQIHDKEKYKNDSYNRNNARNRCILTKSKASGKLTNFQHLSKKEKKNLGLYDKLDSLEIKELEILDDVNNSQSQARNKRKNAN